MHLPMFCDVIPMTNQTQRPFEIGDLVVCSYRYGVGYVTDITETCIYIDDKIGVNPKLKTAMLFKFCSMKS